MQTAVVHLLEHTRTHTAYQVQAVERDCSRRDLVVQDLHAERHPISHAPQQGLHPSHPFHSRMMMEGGILFEFIR